ncbi:response regulator transcription factor [Marinifilum sp. D737]|uniref:response regulator transcription factor n=1 Tax=Marinifilum sp. D737 TaxID=2969628 RepID=UPI002276AF8E|nr:response regulator transcription factor [Marinifilum sp. D737]MCY1634515.1 response regulator transcription factor [Marinifilum sp. D737]
MPRISILIAESTCLIRKGLGSVIQKLGNVEILQPVSNKVELCDIVNRLKPDVLIANTNMLDSGCEDLKKPFIAANKMSLVLISEDKSIEGKYNADALIHYKDNQSKILEIIEEIVNQKAEKKRINKSNETLSSREQNILKHIALGLTNKEIADQLFISIHTVVTHRKNITQKLGIKSVSGLTVYAILNNLINMDEVK